MKILKTYNQLFEENKHTNIVFLIILPYELIDIDPDNMPRQLNKALSNISKYIEFDVDIDYILGDYVIAWEIEIYNDQFYFSRITNPNYLKSKKIKISLSNFNKDNNLLYTIQNTIPIISTVEDFNI
jgi:hypothetical protein